MPTPRPTPTPSQLASRIARSLTPRLATHPPAQGGPAASRASVDDKDGYVLLRGDNDAGGDAEHAEGASDAAEGGRASIDTISRRPTLAIQ